MYILDRWSCIILFYSRYESCFQTSFLKKSFFFPLYFDMSLKWLYFVIYNRCFRKRLVRFGWKLGAEYALLVQTGERGCYCATRRYSGFKLNDRPFGLVVSSSNESRVGPFLQSGGTVESNRSWRQRSLLGQRQTRRRLLQKPFKVDS